MDVIISFPQNSSDFSAKRHTGKSIISFPDDYTVFDIETTGLSPDYDEIIEVAAIRVRNNVVVDTFQSLVKPSSPIDSFITELTGITNDMLTSAPSPDEIIPSFHDFLSHDILVGHNVHFDIKFTYDAALATTGKELSNDYVDTYRLSRKLLPDLAHHRLVDIVESLDVHDNDHHRALSDCHMTADCFKALRTLALQKYHDLSAFYSTFSSRGTDLSKLTPTNANFDQTHPLYNAVCVFTGKLDKMKREEAAQLVINLGGKCANTVTKATNYLILGNTDYLSNVKGNKTEKMRKAEKYKLSGQNIEIIPESVFYDML